MSHTFFVLWEFSTAHTLVLPKKVQKISFKCCDVGTNRIKFGKKLRYFCPWPSHMNTLRLNASLLLWRSISCFTSSSSCRYVTSSFFSRRLFVAYQHTPLLRRGWPAPCIAAAQVAALYDRLFFIIFFTHNIVHELHVWTVRRMSISSPFHIAFSSDNICYVLDNSASRFISICAYYLLMWVFVHSMYTHICEVENDSSKMILYVLEHMSIGISRGT